VRFSEALVGGDRDACGFLSLGQHLEQQVGAAFVELEVAQLVDLCGYPHRSTYADMVTMARTGLRAPGEQEFSRPRLGIVVG